MASTMLTGDRRWAAARKSGMTVLGRVPKPINLPSQRLENHGLDPSVEIVPKGTLTWGNRPSSAVPNVWGSSSLLSPNNDGSSGSPSHVNGRPSSGGSGTRPSTAGSDRSYEPASNAWGPNSRPSSASGTMTSNQISIMDSRPRSAETRPSSSSTQLSRFAETSGESTIAWEATRTAERVGTASSKANEFTLSSGDFPTLGCDKNSDSQMQRGHSSHGRPGSASGTSATQREAPRPLSAGGNVNAYPDRGNMNSWKADDYPYVGHSAPTNINWQRDTQQAQPYPHANIPPQQVGPWHTAPVYSPSGVWNRGGTVGGPHRPAVSPGSYPVEPYAYYPPRFPARPPPNSDPVPSPGGGPGGHNPNNGESYHHHQPPNSYMIPSHPVIPIRSGVYPSPVPHEGYYAPPNAGFCNSSECEVPVIGMSDQPGVYDRRPNQYANLEPGKFHVRPDGHAPAIAKEQKESQHAHEIRPGQYKVLLKQHDHWEDKNGAQEKRLHSVIASPQHIGRGLLPGVTTREEDWRRNRTIDERTVFVKASPQLDSDGEGHSLDPVTTKSLVNSSKEIDVSLISKSEIATFPVHDRKQSPTLKNNASLIEKIEGLNNKARGADGHRVGEEKSKHFKVANKGDHEANVISTITTFTELTPTVTAFDELDVSTENRNQKHTCAANKSDSSEVVEKSHSHGRQRTHVMQSRVEDHSRLRSDSQDADDRTKKYLGRDSSVIGTMTDGEKGPGVPLLDCHTSQEATEDSYANTTCLSFATSSLDSMDHKAQRAKLKEIAMRRAKELQKEEEERIREQKAKALAKLEELNKRTLAQSLNQENHDLSPIDDIQHKQDSGADADVVKIDVTTIEAPSPITVQNSDSLVQANDNLAGSTDFSPMGTSQVSLPVTQASAIPQVMLASSDFHGSSVSKRKQMGSRRINISPEENPSEKAITVDSLGSPHNSDAVAVQILCSDSLPNNEEISMPHKKKSNRNARNNNKLDEAITSSTLPTKAASEGSLDKSLTDGGNTRPSTSVAEATPDPSQSCSGENVVNLGSITPSNQGQSQSTEKVHGRVGNQSKPQSSRKSTRNQQAIRSGDKFHGGEAVFWAPVRLSNKNEPSEESSQKSAFESSNHYSLKNRHDGQNSMRTKRAEMERYVPKPVVKELAQQDNSQEASSLDQVPAVNMTGKLDTESKSSERSGLDGSALGKPQFGTGTKNGEVSKPSKRGKMRASWRQRSSAESPSALQSPSGGGGSVPVKTVLEPSDQNQQLQQNQFQDDDWNSNNDILVPAENHTLPAVIKDEGVLSKQRCHQSDTPAGNKDLRFGSIDMNDIQSRDLDLTESDRRNALRTKNQSAGGEHKKSHWKPKYQTNSHNPRHEDRGDAGHPQVGRFDRESRPQGIENYSLQNDYKSPINQGTGDAERRSARYQEANRGKKVNLDQPKEHASSANQDLLTDAELAPTNLNTQHEQPVNSAPRRQGHHNSRVNRGQDAGKHIHHMNGDKHKGNTHFEYQRVGSYSKAGGSFRQDPIIGGEALDDPQAPGLRYKERGQNYSRRGGHLYEPRSGASVQVGESYNGGE